MGATLSRLSLPFHQNVWNPMLPDTLTFYLVTAFVILLIGLSKGGLGGSAGGAATRW